jgi:hypothetical protein
MNKKTLAAVAIAGSALLGVTTAAPAMASNSNSNSNSNSYSYTTRATHEKRQTDYWGDNCYKFEPRGEDDDFRFSHRVHFKVVVVKAGRQLTVFKHFNGRTVSSENDRDIDWIIVCRRDDNRNDNRNDNWDRNWNDGRNDSWKDNRDYNRNDD